MDQKLSDLTAQCIRCGFCLESCPTFLETGSEAESPRGRIYLIRSMNEGSLAWNGEGREHIDQCLGCRACETACPSGVEYGQILESARSKMSARPSEKALLAGVTNPSAFRLQVALGRLLPGAQMPAWFSRWISGEEPQADLPKPQRKAAWPELAEMPAPVGEVYLLEGCAMRVLYPRVHQALRRLLRRVGHAVKEETGGCCGALHAHAGLDQDAAKRLDALDQAFPGDAPIIVDSAGCGSHLKHSRLGDRVKDASEFLLEHGLADHLADSTGVTARATYHDACHLAHGQGITAEPRELLNAVPGLEMAPLHESDLCCGSAGTYNLTQPAMARRLLERKWANIAKTGASIVALGNPGCHAWIAQAAREKGADVQVLHTLEILEASFSGLPELNAPAITP